MATRCSTIGFRLAPPIALALGFSLFTPAAPAAQQDRIQGPIENNETAILARNVHPKATAANDRGPLDPSTRITGVKLVLGQTGEQTAALDALLEAQRNPSSPDYRNWLTPEEYADRFGLNENDIGKLTSWLQANGFNVETVARARNWITFNGAAEQIAATFHTELHHYDTGGEKHFANATAPSIPAAFAGIVIAIRGLDDFHPKPQRATIQPDLNASNGNHYLAPDDLATIYDIQALYKAGFDGTGQKLAIAGQTDINLADIRGFRAQFNLPAKDPQLVLAGSNPGVSTGDQVEADLDLEWSGAVARNATIVYVYSPDVFESLEYAIDENLAPIISMSYGGCELGASTTYRTLAQQANAEGITWMNASGDSGAAGCDDDGEPVATHPAAVTFPADIPEVTAVGGTEFNEGSGTYWSSQNSANMASALSYIPETAWNDTALGHGIAAGGGGKSALFAKPSWQTGPGVPNDQARDVPDLSLAASGAHDAYAIYMNGTLTAIGGTSAASPSFAGVATILNQYLVTKGGMAKPGLGNMNPALYTLAQGTAGAFHDITAGNNIVPCASGITGCVGGSYGYSAGTGYDLATGLGSIDAYKLVTNWAGVPAAAGTKTTVTASLAQSATTQLTATVSALTGTGTPTGTVTFADGTAALGSEPLTASATAGTATAVLTIKGSALAAGANTITATYAGAGNFGNSTGTVTVTVSTPTIATSTTLSANPASLAQSGSTTLTATVKPASGSSVPTGSVAFTAGKVQLGTANLTGSTAAGSTAAGSTATLTVKGSNLAVGANGILATYAGTSGFGGSTSSTVTVTVTPPPVATTTVATANPATISQSASTEITAMVNPASGKVAPAGTVAFTLGNVSLGTVPLGSSGSTAGVTLLVKGASFAIGKNTVTTTYSGGTGFTGSSAAVTITVNAAATPTTMTVSASPASIAPIATTQITATVKAAAGTSVPTGNVAFMIGSAPLGGVMLSTSGTAALTVKGGNLATGRNTITTTFTPSGNFSGATASVVVTVSPPAVGTTMALGANPASIVSTASTQLTVTLRAASGSASPTGNITLAKGGVSLGSAALTGSGGTATATFVLKGSSLAQGSNLIGATYTGNGSFAAATASMTVTVVAPQRTATTR